MLAQNYEDRVEEIDFSKGVVVSPKLDGIRCIVDINGMWSREGKPLLAGSPHIRQVLTPIFSVDPQVKTDGELYNHKFKDNFNKIVSLIKKQKPTPKELEESKRYVQYWVFDIVKPQPFVKRLWEPPAHLLPMMSPTVRVLKNTTVRSPLDIDKLFKEYRAEGFEGAMIRWGINDIPYEHKRSKYLLKYKDFVTDEFTIINVIAGKGNKATMAAKVECKDSRNEIFEANIEGDWAFARKLLVEKQDVIGKQGTVRYQNLTPDRQVPRIGYLIAIRDYE
jgi:ATP-dependent DNA ligase